VIVDDNPFVRTAEGVRPRAATFHRFAEAVAEVGPFERVDYCIPVASLRPGEQPPALQPVDEHHLHVVPTAPFRGAASYLARLPLMWWRNRRILDGAIREADLVWLKLPASNALLAASACRRHGVARFGYVAGSARAVVEAQDRPGLTGIAARLAAAAYDAVTRSIARGGPALVLDAELFTSVVDEADAAETPLEMAEHPEGRPWRIAWAGRLAGEKGVDDLFRAAAGLGVGGRSVELLVIGDGPQRAALELRAERLGIAERTVWAGYVADPSAYLDLLRTADLFVLPSRAEGVPKVLAEAMAAGVPVIATRTGACAQICGDGARGMLVDPGDPEALSRAIVVAMDDGRGRAARRARALTWAWQHTRRANARRLVAWMAVRFPELFAEPTVADAEPVEGRILPGMPSNPGA
jgi:glycosyltransferase involved in cell wall biosynthesis